MKQKLLVLALHVAIATLLFGCGQQAETGITASIRVPAHMNGPVYGDMIVMGSIADCCVLLPVLCTDKPSTRITDLIFNGLLKYDKDANLVGDLAEKWEMSRDKSTIRFHLRRNVRWQDGKPFTAHDVAYTYGVYVDPKTPTAYASSFMKIQELRVPDDYTVEAIYAEPYAPALDSWVINKILPRHLLSHQDITTCPSRTMPIGTGPYKLREWKVGEKIVLDANPDYYEGKPFISRVLSRTIPDTATMFLELKTGKLDSMQLTPLQHTRQTESDWFKENFTKYRYTPFGYTYLGYNLKDWKFQDKRVRQAITSAIDREGIVQGVLLGLGQVAHSPYKPDTYYYNADVKKWDYNPDLARTLLEDAGWKDTDGDGIIDKDGKPFEFTIITNQGNDLRKNAAVIIQNYLKAVGIKVNVRVIEWAALIKDFLGRRNFEAFLCGWASEVDPDGINQWHSSKTGPNQFNHGHYENSEVDRLLELGVSTYDPPERKRYYDRFQELLAEDQPVTFLWVDTAVQIVHSRFRNIQPAAMGLAHNFEKWYSAPGLQKYEIHE
ncbi:MAG TPA: peptide-binding protein [Desulfomonilaceae bacterium]|nr:peptide-binding protein [Desulfomonilaceae bacterium]